MNDFLVFGLLFAAVAIGWYLGRRSRDDKSELPGEYYRGFRFLLDGGHDNAIDAFIDALEVNSDTLETHIALGKLLRQRGEVARAIRVHQNLLARPSLPRAQVEQAHLELARDYISAGLLDRAERLLLDLGTESRELRRKAWRYLLEIYQSERDWGQAIEVARKLLPRKGFLGSGVEVDEPGQAVPVILAHYYCELAEDKRDKGDIDAARELLQLALEYDADCVRASILLGSVERQSGRYRQAIKALRRVQRQDPDYVYETVPALRDCYQALGDSRSLRVYLRDCLDEHPSPPLVLAVTEALQQADGPEEAYRFLVTELERLPSLRGVEKLLQLEAGATAGEKRAGLQRLQGLVRRLLEQRPTYRCSHCGFSGRQLHWFCPGCRYWGTLKNIRGTTME
ncbi:lipopolysaccharide assembly protein LapB [Haliea sp. E17]|uniref:lipopolysaccharide assembly protein LapB n=1 Tax=Haliea sp. E17 TaxID=3401576 RepID=UPI003AAAA7B8